MRDPYRGRRHRLLLALENQTLQMPAPDDAALDVMSETIGPMRRAALETYPYRLAVLHGSYEPSPAPSALLGPLPQLSPRGFLVYPRPSK